MSNPPTRPARDGGDLGRLDPATLRQELRDALVRGSVGRTDRHRADPERLRHPEVLPDAEEIAGSKTTNPTRLLAATATGAVRDSLNVGGLNEADAMFLAYPKPDGWNQDLREMCRVRTDRSRPSSSGSNRIPIRSARPARASRRSTSMNGQYAWAQLHAYAGDLDKAIERWQVAKQIADAKVPGAVAMMEETLGLACFHKAEMDNGVYRTPGELLSPAAHQRTAVPRQHGRWPRRSSIS